MGWITTYVNQALKAPGPMAKKPEPSAAPVVRAPSLMGPFLVQGHFMDKAESLTSGESAWAPPLCPGPDVFLVSGSAVQTT